MVNILPKDVLSDFKSHKFIILILCIGMFPIWGNGYCSYVLALLFPLLFVSRFNGISLSILIFSIVYTLRISQSGEGMTLSAYILNLFFPIILYQTGIYLGKRFRYPGSGIFLLTIMAVCLALPAIIFNIQDIIATGQLVNPIRIVTFGDSDGFRSATGYGLMVSLLCGSIGCLFIPLSKFRADRILKYIILIGCIGALTTTLHLVNRTGLALAAISIVVSLALPPHNFKRVVNLILATSIVVGIFVVYINDFQGYFDVIDAYAERNTGISSIDSAGGRTERWTEGIIQIFEEPFGNSKGLRWDGGYNYAHNLILDAGLKGGVISLLISLFLVLVFLRYIWKMRDANVITGFERDVTIFLGVTLVAQSMVEPVIDALPQYFWYFLFFLGLLTTSKFKSNMLTNAC